MIENKLNLAVFISGRGSNLQSLIDACQEDNYPAQISVVLSNKPNVQGLERAKKAGIPTLTIPHKDFETKEAFEGTILEALKDYPIDLICLAGFMRILSPYFIGHWPDKIINIHPSLLPDYKGLNTHERALADGQKEVGCTIHHVVPEMDSGPIIMQKKVPVLDGDTPETLAERVLEQEHIAYPEAVRLLAETR
ncbi:MAG: phosphoribosylglycinamide formyltransferase [Micavibrio sp.]|nr:MAG: phosphoribosylglycinamide formyltransferase [Micavibrio sp.]